MTAVDFALSPGLEASAPPQRRDGVRLMVARPAGIEHAEFARDRPAPRAGRPGRRQHLGHAPGRGRRHPGRPPAARAVDRPLRDPARRRRLGARGAPARPGQGPRERPRRGRADPPTRGRRRHRARASSRRAATAVDSPGAGRGRRDRVPRPGGRPIRYAYVAGEPPLPAYQTVFARDPGSAEMPSAARPFTAEVVTDLATRGVAVAPLLLHTGVSSQDVGEPPQPERYRVPGATARLVNATRSWGGRVVAVGTTVTRALESAAGADGVVLAREGWTDLVLGPGRPARVVDGLVTGWHAPGPPPGAPAGGRRSGAGGGRLRGGGARALPLARVRRQLPAAPVAGRSGRQHARRRTP